MTPAEFVAKWSAHELKERAACQEHFLDLCRLLGYPTPAESDPKGERFCFERGASKQSGGVLAAYGRPEELTDELLSRLLDLNLRRAADEERGILVRP